MSVLHVTPAAAATVTFRQFVTCRAIDETKSPYEPIGITDVFFTNQEKVWALLVLENVQPTITVSLAYIRPNGIEQGRATHDFVEKILSYAVYLDIAEVSRHTGLWQVEAYLDGELYSTIFFELASPGPRLRLVETRFHPGADEPLYVGDLATARYTLQNVGVSSASKIEVTVVDAPSEVVVVETTKPTDLSPDESATWVVAMRPTAAGTFKVTLNVLMNDEKQVLRYFNQRETFDALTITLTASLKPAFLVIQHVVTQPNTSEPFYVGDIGTITYVVQNTGQMTGKDVEIKVVRASAEIEVVQVTGPKDLEPGATDEWQVNVKATKPGTYEVYVSFYANGDKVIFQVEGQAQKIKEFKTTVAAAERPFLQTYGLYVALVVIVLVAVAAVLMWKRRGGAAAPPLPMPVPPTPAPTVTPAPAVAGLKFCISCGSQIPETSAFCPRCGEQQP